MTTKDSAVTIPISPPDDDLDIDRGALFKLLSIVVAARLLTEGWGWGRGTDVDQVEAAAEAATRAVAAILPAIVALARKTQRAIATEMKKPEMERATRGMIATWSASDLLTGYTLSVWMEDGELRSELELAHPVQVHVYFRPAEPAGAGSSSRQ